MDFSSPPRRPRAESIVPMINVVFLLLIFFLMTATIAPPEPLDVTPPESAAETEREADRALFVDAAGGLAWGEARGAEVLPALVAARAASPAPAPLAIRADRRVEAARIARLLAELAAHGITETEIVTGPLP